MLLGLDILWETKAVLDLVKKNLIIGDNSIPIETRETKAINAVAFSASRSRIAAGGSGWIEIEFPVRFNDEVWWMG